MTEIMHNATALKEENMHEQDSPKHVLNALNDDCIQEILLRIKNTEDFLSAAEVCDRFQENAKICIPPHFKEIKINEYESSSNYLSLKRVHCFLRIFGPSLESIHLDIYKNYTFADPTLINTIANFCGETLKSLKIWGTSIYYKSNELYKIELKERSSFPALEKLEVFSVQLRNLQPSLENGGSLLKKMDLQSVKMDGSDWLACEFPELKQVKLGLVDGLADDVLIEFIQRNPQLRSLELSKTKSNQMILDRIGHRTCKLQHLVIETSFCMGQEPNFVALGGLRQLKSLGISSPHISIQALIKSFAENEVPLEDVRIRYTAANFIDNLVKLKLIKKLEVYDISNEMLGQILQNLPVLNKLIVISKFVTVDGIKRALKYGQYSQHINIRNAHFSITLEEYNSIVALARVRQLKVKIWLHKKDGIPKEVRWGRSIWLDIY